MENNNLENNEVVFGVEDVKVPKAYTIYLVIRWIVKNICIWGFIIIIGISQAYEDDPKYVMMEDILKNILIGIVIAAIILVGTYLFIDGCLILLSRKLKCKEMVSGTIKVEDIKKIEEQGLTSYEYTIGLSYMYDNTCYTYRYTATSFEEDTYKDGDKLSVYISPKDPRCLMIEKDNIKNGICITKGIIGGIILAPFALVVGAYILLKILEGLLFVLEGIQDMLI